MRAKEVYFVDYCKKCRHFTKGEDETPCNHCLSVGGRIDSHKPVDFEKRKDWENGVSMP